MVEWSKTLSLCYPDAYLSKNHYANSLDIVVDIVIDIVK